MQTSDFPCCSNQKTVSFLCKDFGHGDCNGVLFASTRYHFVEVSGYFVVHKLVFETKLCKRLIEIIVTIPESATNSSFFSLVSFFKTFFYLWLLWAVVRSLLGSSCRWNHNIIVETERNGYILILAANYVSRAFDSGAHPQLIYSVISRSLGCLCWKGIRKQLRAA